MGTPANIDQVNDNAVRRPQSVFHVCRRFLGFRTNYDFILWAVVSSFMVLFSFIRSKYLHPPTFRKLACPGEWYWLQQDPYNFGIFLHLFSVIPAGFLSILQFIPAIRNKTVLVHHYIGYLVMLLVFLGDIGAVLVARRSMGGDLSIQAAVAFLTVATIGAMYLAWYNIRRQQIDQHRKWMLRAMFWMGVIVTMRIVQFFTILAISYVGGYATLWTCDEVMFVTGNTTTYYEEFPACRLGVETYVGVPADLRSRLHIGSAVRLTFGMATWTAIVLHTFGVELYLHLTPNESERLRIISYHKQRTAGFALPGSAGITSDRWGDGRPWNPPRKVTE